MLCSLDTWETQLWRSQVLNEANGWEKTFRARSTAPIPTKLVAKFTGLLRVIKALPFVAMRELLPDNIAMIVQLEGAACRMGTRHATAKRDAVTADLGGMICGHCGRQASRTPVSCSVQEAFPSSWVDRTEKLHGICHVTQFWHV